jgi:hypothetical protein
VMSGSADFRANSSYLVKQTALKIVVATATILISTVATHAMAAPITGHRGGATKNSDLAEHLAAVRLHVNDECSRADEMLRYFAKDHDDDPAVVATEIFVVRNSTTASCVQENLEALSTAVGMARFHKHPLQRKLKEEIGAAALSVLEKENLLRSHPITC